MTTVPKMLPVVIDAIDANVSSLDKPTMATPRNQLPLREKSVGKIIKHPLIRGSRKQVRARLTGRFRRQHADAVESSKRSLESLSRLADTPGYEMLRDLVPTYRAIVGELVALDCQSPLVERKLTEISARLDNISRRLATRIGESRLVS